MAPTTEITVAGGIRFNVEGEASDVERVILDAARGAIMELAWLTEAETGQRIAINPAMVAVVRAAAS